jgi:hypothetical protein
VAHDAAQPADVARDDGDAARRGLERDEAEALAARRHEHDVRRPVVGGEQVVRLRRDPRDAVRDADRRGERAQASRLGLALGAARPADDEEARTGVAQSG